MELFSNLDNLGKETSILNRFLFPAPAKSYDWGTYPGELLCVVGREGNIVPCLLLPGVSNHTSVGTDPFQFEDPASVLVIYCHANGEDVGVLYEAGHWICDTLGVHVLIPEYPGYGMAPGQPNEVSVLRNIQAAYDFAIEGLLWDPERIVFFGRSIGTGPAVALASQLKCGGLVLVSPFTSVKDMVRHHAGAVLSFLTTELSNMFPNQERIAGVTCPTLIVHGAADRVISCEQARRLHAACKARDRRLVVLEGIGHHGIDLHFAVAYESPRLFPLEGRPHYIDVDLFLAGSSCQANRVASPVPAFDCLSRTWARPTLERAEVPFIRSSPGSGTLDFAAEWGVLLRSSQLGSGLLLSDAAAAPVTRRGTMTTVTDEGLLDHLTTDVLAEQQQFVKARSASSPDKRHPAPTPRAGIGAGEAETVLRTDDNGRVVEVPVPPAGPGLPSSGDARLVIY